MPQTGGGTAQTLAQQIAAALNISVSKAQAAITKAIQSGSSPSDKNFLTAVQGFLGGGGGGNTPGGNPPQPPTPPGGGGGGGGSGGSSGVLTPQQKAALRASYAEILHRWGLSPGVGGLDNLINTAVGGKWSSTQFMQAVRRTKAYKQNFPGLQSRSGMSEGEYLSKFRVYRDMAKDIDRNITKKDFAYALNKGIDTREWKVRIDAIDSMNKNQDILDWYERVLKSQGKIKPKEQLNAKERFRIVTRQNSVGFENAWQEAWLSYNLDKLGVTIGGAGKDFTRKEINKLINQAETATPGFEVERLGAAEFGQIGAQLDVSGNNEGAPIPLSFLYGKGLTKKDLVEAALGGPKAGQVQSKLAEIQAEWNANQQEKANVQLVQSGEGKSRVIGGGVSKTAGY